jgi:hypothetical protein
MNERSQIPRAPPNPSAKKGHGTDIRVLTSRIGTYSRFDPTDPKDRAILCRIPGCGKYNHRRTFCSTHSPSEVQPIIVAAAAEEER